MNMKKIMTIMALMCAVTIPVNAQSENSQTTEPESKIEKMMRLTKAANDNPDDWQAQAEAGHFLIDKENGIYNLSQAEKYYERLFQLVLKHKREIPDSVIMATGMTMAMIASERKNLDKALLYVDQFRNADKEGTGLSDGIIYGLDTMGWLYSTMKEDMVSALYYIMELRDRATRDKKPGIENTDVTTAMMFEGVLSQYRKLFSDRLLELTLDGKKYTIIALNDWNIEKPFIGWGLQGDKPFILGYGEDGKVYDVLHGKMEYSFFYDKDGISQRENSNTRLITVTPEQRQQLVEAYRKYMKKADKKKK